MLHNYEEKENIQDKIDYFNNLLGVPVRFLPADILEGGCSLPALTILGDSIREECKNSRDRELYDLCDLFSEHRPESLEPTESKNIRVIPARWARSEKMKMYQIDCYLRRTFGVEEYKKIVTQCYPRPDESITADSLISSIVKFVEKIEIREDLIDILRGGHTIGVSIYTDKKNNVFLCYTNTGDKATDDNSGTYIIPVLKSNQIYLDELIYILKEGCYSHQHPYRRKGVFTPPFPPSSEEVLKLVANCAGFKDSGALFNHEQLSDKTVTTIYHDDGERMIFLHLPQQPQKEGNCTVSNPKKNLLGQLFCHALDEQNGIADRVSKKKIRSCYKTLTWSLRWNAVENFLKHPTIPTDIKMSHMLGLLLKRCSELPRYIENYKKLLNEYIKCFLGNEKQMRENMQLQNSILDKVKERNKRSEDRNDLEEVTKAIERFQDDLLKMMIKQKPSELLSNSIYNPKESVVPSEESQQEQVIMKSYQKRHSKFVNT